MSRKAYGTLSGLVAATVVQNVSCLACGLTGRARAGALSPEFWVFRPAFRAKSLAEVDTVLGPDAVAGIAASSASNNPARVSVTIRRRVSA